MQPYHWILLTIEVAAQIAFIVRALIYPHREPAARIAWLLVIIFVPIVGMIAYMLLGEARMSARRRDRFAAIDAALPRPSGDSAVATSLAQGQWAAPFALGSSVNRLAPSGGNRATLLPDSNSAIDAMVADIDAAQATVHICFYIWLTDNNGTKLIDAVCRAAARGVKTRVLADALGSRGLIRSAEWQRMRDAGAEVRAALAVGNLLWTLLRGRVDLRNHRKVLVIDNRLTWCGSQNAADPEFRVKPRFAPWVDVMVRWEGPIARDNQLLFAGDWMGSLGDDIGELLTDAAPPAAGNIAAQVIGTGPTRHGASMTACFAELVHAARREIVITTPYFVPDDAILSALLACALRGVRTVMVLPARNDSRVVAATAKSYYRALLDSGVELYEFKGGLLHAKTMIVDEEAGMIGSANLDRRSFELNFENNILFADRELAMALRARQDEWLARSQRVTPETVDAYSVGARIGQNLMATLSPLF